MPPELLQYPPIAQQFILRDVAPHKPTSVRLGWAEAVMKFVRGLAGCGSNEQWVKLLADISSDNTAVLYCQVGTTKV